MICPNHAQECVQARSKVIHRSTKRGLPRRPRAVRSRHQARVLTLEHLESRTLLTIMPHGVPDWIEQGPGPITGGQVEGLGAQNSPVAGAVEAIAAHPFDANIVYIGTVNGGVWRTYSANFPNDGVDNDGDGLFDEGDENPNWTPLTDQLPSLAISAIAFSPLDVHHQTLFAGTGDFRSGSSVTSGGPAVGLYRTRDGGDTWDIIGPELAGFRIRSIVPTSLGTPDTQVILVATVDGGGVYRSVNGGLNFTRISGTPGVGDGIDNDGDGAIDEANELNLPNASASHLVADPGNPNRFYAAVPLFGVYRSDNGGVNWQQVNNGLGNAQVAAGTAQRIELAVSPVGPNPVYAALISQLPAANGQTLNGVFRSLDLGANWTALDLPQTNEGGNPIGLSPNPKPGQQGGIHFSIVADPNNANVIFVGGDRQPRTGPDGVEGTNDDAFPNSIGCNDFSGRHFRGNAALAAGTQFAAVNCNNAGGTSPHADSRDMVFDADQNIIESDDGGIYRLVDPNLSSRRWVSLNGNLRVTEFYSVAYDPVNHTVIGGAQDVGASEQNAPDNFTWRAQTTADGGFVAVDTVSPGQDALHYFSIQCLGGFARARLDDTNNEFDQDAVSLIVNGANNNTLFAVERTIAPNPNSRSCLNNRGTVQFIQPYVLNNVFPDQLLIGTSFLYEGIFRGDELTALGGLQNGDGADNDGDGLIDENDEIGPLNPVGRVTAMVYGGRRGGQDNGEVIYVGSSGGVVNGTFGTLFLRTTNTTDSLADFVTLTNYPGASPQDIALDPDDWQSGYVLDANSNVYRFVNAGANPGDWLDISSLTNLPQLTTKLRTIEVYGNGPAPNNEVVLVGGEGGVFRTLNPQAGPATLWTEFGGSLPNAVVMDLHYVRRFDPDHPNDPRNDVLLAGTLGRGAWLLTGASGEITTPSDLQIDGFDLTVFNDTIRLVLDEDNPLLLNVFLNNNTPDPTYSVPLAALQTIHVNGFAGNDTLIVDFANGNPIPFIGLDFAGGPGNDRVRILGTDAEETFTLDAAGIRTGVQVQDGAMGRAAVMSLETDEVEIQAAGGMDTVDVHGTSDALSLLTINGGAAEDHFTLSPRDMNLDSFAGALRLEGGGGINRLAIDDRNHPGNRSFSLTDMTVDWNGFTLLTYIGFLYLDIQAGTGDNTFDIDSTTIGHTTIASGSGADVFNVTAASRNLENVLGELVLNGEAGEDQISVIDQVGDPHTYRLTSDSLTRTGWFLGQLEFSSIYSLALTTGNEANTFDINDTSYNLEINAGTEGDTFYVTGVSNLLSDLHGDVTIAGGEGSDSIFLYDRANDFDDNYVIAGNGVQSSGFVWTFDFTSIENTTLEAGGGDSFFDVQSTQGNFTIRAGSGMDHFLVTQFSEIDELGGDLLLDGGVDSDVLEVFDVQHDDPETYTITPSSVSRTGTFTVEYAAVESLRLDSGDGGSTFDINDTDRQTPITINAGGGDDTFRVNGPPSSELTLNGQEPRVQPGDSLIVIGANGEGIYQPGDLSGSGSITMDGETIQFTGLEPISVSGFESFSMVTPGVTDELTIASPTPCVTRISGTSSGTTFESLDWSDVTRFTLDTGRGDDSITIQESSCSSQAMGDADEFRISTGEGDDRIRIAWPDASQSSAGRVITLMGGTSFTGDTLTILHDGSSNLVKYQPGYEAGTGAISVGMRRRAVFAGIELVQQRAGDPKMPAAPILMLAAGSDTGLPGQPETFSDRITSDTHPMFMVSAERGTTVTLFIRDSDGNLMPVSQRMAESDGSGDDSAGATLEEVLNAIFIMGVGTVALPELFPLGALTMAAAVAEDREGNKSALTTLEFYFDPLGPTLRSVTRPDGLNVVGQEMFGPTPLIMSLDLSFFDLGVGGLAGGLSSRPPVDESAVTNPQNYLLVGDRLGAMPIASAEIISTGTDSVSGGPGTGHSGAVIVDGSDRDEHGARSGSMNVGGWKLIEEMVRFADQGASNMGSGVLVVGASGQALQAITSVASMLGLSMTVVTSSQIATVPFQNFRVIYVPSDASNVPGGISELDLMLLEQRQGDLISFVAMGGSLVALSESGAAAPYRWLGLAAQAPPIDTGSSTQRLYQTPAVAAAGWSITDAALNLGIPWHFRFANTTGFGALVPFVRSVGIDGIAGNADDQVVTLGLAPGSPVMDSRMPGRTTTVRLHFDSALRDDQYRILLSPSIADIAGNSITSPGLGVPLTQQQSGSFPQLTFPTCPAGSHLELVGIPFGYTWRCAPDLSTWVDVGVPGSFAVDTRPEIGTFYQGSWYIDLNGNGVFDPGGDASKNHDIVWKFGQSGDFPVVGDWDGDGFDEIGVFGLRGEAATFELDVNGNGAFDPAHGDMAFTVDRILIGGLRQPIAGDFNPAVPGDELGFLRNDTWLIDFDGDHQFGEVGETIVTNMRGQPLAGNWGDFAAAGIDHVATYNGGVFQFDMDGNLQFELARDLVQIPFEFPGGDPEIAVTADWDGDGNDTIGLFVRDREGVVPREAAEWYLDLGIPNDNVFPGDGLFQPPPTGRPGVAADQQDIFYQFGDILALPVVGNFDPPAAGLLPEPEEPGLIPGGGDDGHSPTIERLRLVGGSRRFNAVLVQFSERLQPTAAGSATNYSLIDLGRDHRPGTRDDRLIRLLSADYDPAGHDVLLVMARQLRQNHVYQLVIRGDGIADLTNNLLDGDGDGVAGGDFEAIVGRGRTVTFVDGDGDVVTLTLVRGGVMELTVSGATGVQITLQDTNGRPTILSGTVRTQPGSDGRVTLAGPFQAPAVFENRLPVCGLGQHGCFEFGVISAETVDALLESGALGRTAR